jgi:uncharacterized membrane protein
MEQIMIAVTASFLCSALLGMRLTFPAFAPIMLAATIAAFALQGALAGCLVLALAQAGYVTGILMRALAPARETRPALRRATAR